VREEFKKKYMYLFYISFFLYQVEYKKPLGFCVTKTSDGQPIEFEPVSNKQKNLQTIYFNYDTIVDFSIGIQEEVKVAKQDNSLNLTQKMSPFDDQDKEMNNENLKAEIEGLLFSTKLRKFLF